MQHPAPRAMSTGTDEMSGISEFNDSVNLHLAKLKNQAHDENTVMMEKLMSENNVLRRQLPKLRDSKGRDVTNWIILLHEAIDEKDAKVELLEATLAEQRQRFENHRQEHYRKANALEDKIKDFTSRIDDSTIITSADVVSVHHEVEDMKSELMAEQINQLEADVMHYQNEAETAKAELAKLKQQLEDMEEEHTEGASDLEERYANAVGEIEQLKEDVEKRDKEIDRLRRQTTEAVPDDKLSLAERLKDDLRRIAVDWEQNVSLRTEIEKLLEGADNDETYSERCEKLNRDRLSVEHELRSNSDISPCSTPDIDPTGTLSKSTNVVVENSRRFHDISNRMIERLRSFLKILAQILLNLNTGNPDVNRILEASKLDIEADFVELTNALKKLADSEQTLHDSIMEQSVEEVVTPRAEENTKSLKQRIVTLEENLRSELAKKEKLMSSLNLQKLRFTEAIDEKATMQDSIQKLEYIIREQEDELEMGQRAKQALIEAREQFDEMFENYERDQSELIRVKEMCAQYKRVLAERDDALRKLNEEVDYYVAHEAKYEEQERQLDRIIKQFDNFKLDGLIDPEVPSPQHQDAVMKLAAKVSRVKRIAKESKEHCYALTTYIQSIVDTLVGKKTYKEIECPSLVSPEAHSALMDFVANNSEQVVDKLETSEKILAKKLEELRNYFGTDETSLKSDLSLHGVVTQTSADVVTELKQSFEEANMLVQLIKRNESENVDPKQVVMFESMMDLARSSRNKIHRVRKAVEERRSRLESSPGRPVSEQLGKIYSVLSSNENIDSTNKQAQKRVKARR